MTPCWVVEATLHLIVETHSSVAHPTKNANGFELVLRRRLMAERSRFSGDKRENKTKKKEGTDERTAAARSLVVALVKRR